MITTKIMVTQKGFSFVNPFKGVDPAFDILKSFGLRQVFLIVIVVFNLLHVAPLHYTVFLSH